MTAEKLGFDDYGNVSKVESLLRGDDVRNVYKRSSIILSQMESAFAEKYDLKGILKSYDGDAHDLQVGGLLSRLWDKDQTGLEVHNPIEKANAEILEKYRANTSRQHWLGTLTSVIGFQFNMVRRNKPEDPTVYSKLAERIVQAFNEAKTEVETARKDKRKPNENLENDNHSAELEADRKIRTEAVSITADDFFEQVESQDQLGLVAETKKIQTPSFLKNLFDTAGIKYDENYDYFSANVKLSDPQMQGLMGAYYFSRDRSVVFPAHIVSYFEGLDIPADQYTALKKGVVYNELMHKILFRHYVLGQNPDIDFSQPSYKDDPFFRDLGEVMRGGEFGLAALSLKSTLETKGYTKGEIDEFIRFMQEFELLSDFASLSATKYELTRIQHNDVMQKYFWRNPFAGYDKTNQFMEGIIEDIKSNRYFAGKDYNEILSAKELTLEEYKIVVEAYEKKSQEILTRWNKMFGKSDYVITKIFREKTNVPVKPQPNKPNTQNEEATPNSKIDLDTIGILTIECTEKVTKNGTERGKVKLEFQTDPDANRYKITCKDPQKNTTQIFYYPKKNVSASDRVPDQADPIIYPYYGATIDITIEAQYKDGTTVTTGPPLTVQFEVKSNGTPMPPAQPPAAPSTIPPNVINAPANKNNAPNRYYATGTRMQSLFPSIKKKDAEGCVAFVNRYDQIYDGRGHRFWLSQAWDMAAKVTEFKGTAKYNIFANQKIPSFKSVADSRNYIADLINQNKSTIQSADYQVGDMVSLYYPQSPKQQEAHTEGITFNPPLISTHAGVITEQNGKLFITHNIDGTLYSDPLQDFTHGTGGKGNSLLTGLYDVQTKLDKRRNNFKPKDMELLRQKPFAYRNEKYSLMLKNVPHNVMYVRIKGKSGTAYASSMVTLKRVGLDKDADVKNGLAKFEFPIQPGFIRDPAKKSSWMPEQGDLYYSTQPFNNSVAPNFATTPVKTNLQIDNNSVNGW